MDIKAYKHKIVKAIVEEFNKNSSTRSTHISTKKLFPSYYTGLGDYDFEELEAFDEAIREGLSEGLFSATRDERCNIFKTIIATKEQAERLANDLRVVSRETYIQRIRSVLTRYQDSSCSQVKAWVETELGAGNLRQASNVVRYDGKVDLFDLEWRLDTLLQGCERIANLTDDILCRNLSTTFDYGGSKEFERSYMEKTAKILAPSLAASGVSAREILKTFHVLENPACVWIKGYGQLQFTNGDKITLLPSGDGIALSRAVVDQISSVCGADSIFSIENLTTFNSFKPKPGQMIVFTSGYANSLVIRFLQCIYIVGQIQNFYHFGDLDAYGFDILRDLNVRLSFCVRPYLMDIATYEQNKSRAIKMTKGNHRLMELQLQTDFFASETRDLFDLLLKEGKTLEQEGILFT